MPSESVVHEPQTSLPSAKLDARWALGLGHVLATALFGFLFLLFAYLPVRPTDLWVHVLYGQWMLDHRSIPSEDPFLVLAQGIRVVDTAWLSQLLLGFVARSAGVIGIANQFALVMLASFLVLARVFYCQSHRLFTSLIGVVIVFTLASSRITTVRPENFGLLCFAGLLWLLVRRGGTIQRTGWQLWLGIPILFICWANLHGSFLCGLIVLACICLGDGIDAIWRGRSIRAWIAEPRAIASLLLLQLAFIGSLVNPYGIDLAMQTAFFAGTENLADVLEWQPFGIRGAGGIEFVLSCVLLVCVFRHSRRPIPVSHVLLLVCFAVASLIYIRALIWYAVVYAYVLVPHLENLIERAQWTWSLATIRRPDPVPRENETGLPPGRSWRYTLICGLIIWIAFALSPISTGLLGGSEREMAQILDDETPIALSNYLRENPPDGQIFNPQWWGDWLIWNGPPDLKPFVTSNIHVVPRQVWMDYMRILNVQPGWQSALQRYRITTVIADREQSLVLADVLRTDPEWRLEYDDRRAMVFTRAVPEKRQIDGMTVEQRQLRSTEPVSGLVTSPAERNQHPAVSDSAQELLEGDPREEI